MEGWLAGWISAGSLSRPVSSWYRALHLAYGKKPAFFTLRRRGVQLLLGEGIPLEEVFIERCRITALIGLFDFTRKMKW
jgi:hypothetical protein